MKFYIDVIGRVLKKIKLGGEIVKKLIVFLVKTVVTLILAFLGVIGIIIAAAFIMEKFEDDDDFDFDEDDFEEEAAPASAG